jgi:hypothetical protein
MSNKINLLELILTYHNSLFLLFDLLTDKIQIDEIKDIIKNISCNKNKMTDLYGFTRCSSAYTYLNKILFKNNNSNSNMYDGNFTSDDIINNLNNYNKIEIDITPDHVFILYKLHNVWYMFSSWIKIYNFNIFKINDIHFFITKLCKYFHYNKKDKIYYYFLQKYFMYKISSNNKSLYITKDIRTLNYIINNINKKYNDKYSFIIDDYKGSDSGKHTISFKFDNIDSNDVIINFKTYINNIYNAIYTYVDNNTSQFSNEKKFIKKMINDTNKTNDIDKILSYIFNNTKINSILNNLIPDMHGNDIIHINKYFNILDGLSLLIVEILHIFNVVNDINNKIILKEPEYNDNVYKFNDHLTSKYGNMLVDNIHKNKYYYGFLSGGKYNFFDTSNKTFVVKHKNKKNEIHKYGVLYTNEDNHNDIINIFYNLYDLIGMCYDKKKENCMMNLFDILKKDIYVEYSDKSRVEIMNIIKHHINTSKEYILVMYYDNTPYIFFNRYYTTVDSFMYSPILNDNSNISKYNSFMVMYYKYDKLFFIESDYEYLLDNLFTNIVPFNNNVYIHDDQYTYIYNIKIKIYNINNKMTTDIHTKIRSYIAKYTNILNYNNTNEMFINIYKNKNENKTFSISDFMKLNDIINYKNNYDEISSFYVHKDDINYNPMLDKSHNNIFDLKEIYLKFRSFNINFEKYLSKIYGDLYKEKNITKDIIIHNEKYITNSKLNEICTKTYIKLLYKEHNEKINFLLYTYCLIKKLLNSKIKTNKYTFDEDEYSNDDYVFLFKGGMALNILYYDSILKYNNSNFKNILLESFSESDYDFSIYINKTSHKFNTTDKIVKFKLKLYIILNMIKNKLNLNFIKNKLDYNELLYNIKYKFDTYYLIYKKNDEIVKDIVKYGEKYSTENYNNIFSKGIYSYYDPSIYYLYTDKNDNILDYDKYHLNMKKMNDIYICANNNDDDIVFTNNLFDNYYYLTFNHSLFFNEKTNFDLYRIKLNINIDDILIKTKYTDSSIINYTNNENIFSEVLDISIFEQHHVDNFKNKYNVYNYDSLLNDKYIGVDLYSQNNFDNNYPDNINDNISDNINDNDNDNINDISMEFISSNKNVDINIISDIYTVDDIFKILFQYIFPWINSKYNKRSFRLFYIIHEKYITAFNDILAYINYNNNNKNIEYIGNDKQSFNSFFDIFSGIKIADQIKNETDISNNIINILTLFNCINNIDVNNLYIYISMAHIFKNIFGEHIFKHIFPDIVIYDQKHTNVNNFEHNIDHIDKFLEINNDENFVDYKNNHSIFFQNIKSFLDNISHICNSISNLNYNNNEKKLNN